MNFRKLLAGGLVSACTVAAASNAPLTNYDRAQAQLAAAAPVHAPAMGGRFKAQFSNAATTVPSFLWATADAAAAEVGPVALNSLVDARAREYLRLNSGALQLTDKRIADARLFNVHDLGHGPVTARYQQSFNGIDVFGRQLNVLMTREGKPVAISGAFAATPDSAAPAFSLRPQDAVVAAGSQLGLALNLAALTPSRQQDAYQWFDFGTAGSGLQLSRQPRVKSVYYPSSTGLIPAYYVELFAGSGSGSLAYSFVMSATDGSLLFRNNLTANDAGTAYSYRVFADTDGIHQPFDQPLGNGFDPFPGTSISDVLPRPSATANLVTLANGPISTNDPWLAANATTTTGNNVDSFLDTGIILGVQGTYVVTDGYQANSGDLRTALTSANTFDYAIKADDDPSQTIPKNAAIVNLFYMNNWLHDWWYDHGFNEVSGNGQTSNFGRGGSEGDPISAQGQDASGRDNSNMSTPADGSSPTEQMFLFDGAVVGEVRETMPVDSGKLTFTTASFGATTFDVTGTAALANETSGTSMTDGCSAAPALPVTGTTTPATPDLNLLGKIALVDRGTCSFTTKEQFATLSGATALVVINNVDGPPILMGNADLPTLPVNLPVPTTDMLYTLPAVMITKADGDALKAMIAAGKTITMHVQREPSIDYDGTLDEQIIAHEFFHHVSNRLVNDANGLTNTQGGGMGEGWSDFDALLLSARADDRDVPGNDRYQGAYALAFYAIPGIVPVSYYYYGIRRAPYSTDFTKNALTFKYIQDGVALPTQSPFSGGQDGASNSEVHNVGEIWSNTLWNCYVGILNDPRHSFVQARSNMMDYIIGGLKMTPTAPTMTQARDGVLATVLAADRQDYAECAHGFAVRGMGRNAVSPASNSTDNSGVMEDFTEFEVAPIAALTASPVSGVSPLTVALDASQSKDSDTGDSVVSYTFDFGDGSATVTQATPTISHTYTLGAGAAASSYTPSVVVADTFGLTSTNLAAASITVSPQAVANQAPTAVLTATPLSGTAPLVVNLDGSGSSDPDNGDKVASYSVDFGDGSAVVTQTTPAVSHTYSAAGSYVAKLTVTDSHNAISNAVQQTITVTAATVPNTAPTASLKATPVSGTAPLVVNLDGSASSDQDAGDSISTYAFSFGDGSAVVTQAAATISHTYSTAGTYTASLTVTDSHSASSTNTTQQTITVSAPATTVNTAPVARMTATPSAGTVALTVKFDGSTSSDADAGDSIASYRFDFGDGSAVVTQTTATASHTYNSVGSYIATLTVMDTHAATSAAPATTIVTVSAVPVATAPTENRLGGGAFGLPVLLMLGSLAAVRRRRRSIR